MFLDHNRINLENTNRKYLEVLQMNGNTTLLKINGQGKT